MTKILIRTQKGELINYDQVVNIFDNDGPDAIVGSITNGNRERGVYFFHSKNKKQREKWMQAFRREFESAGNLPTYIIDVNDEATGVK